MVITLLLAPYTFPALRGRSKSNCPAMPRPTRVGGGGGGGGAVQTFNQVLGRFNGPALVPGFILFHLRSHDQNMANGPSYIALLIFSLSLSAGHLKHDNIVKEFQVSGIALYYLNLRVDRVLLMFNLN